MFNSAVETRPVWSVPYFFISSVKCELHCILEQVRCLLGVAGVLEDPVFEAPEVRKCTVCFKLPCFNRQSWV